LVHVPSEQRSDFEWITFKVKAGEFVGLTGETGSGKSTTFQLIERFFDVDQLKRELPVNELRKVGAETTAPQVNFAEGDKVTWTKSDADIPSGKIGTVQQRSEDDAAKYVVHFPRGMIKLDGRDITEYNPRWLRAQIGVVSQSAQLLPLTVRDNLILACQEEPTAEEIKKACIAADIWDSINDPKVFPNGLETRMTTTVSIAGGEKQRICIARAILANAPILFLDEATSALDESTQAKVQAALDKLMVGRTTIAIAHRLSTIKNADRIIALRGKKSAQRHEQETRALEWLKNNSEADAKAALAYVKEESAQSNEETSANPCEELATTEELLEMVSYRPILCACVQRYAHASGMFRQSSPGRQVVAYLAPSGAMAGTMSYWLNPKEVSTGRCGRRT
jgi:ABC-type multidrug transport system ATPase subunit